MKRINEKSAGGPAWVDAYWFQRLLEILPGALMWATLAAPAVLSVFKPVWVAYFIIGYDLYWTVKSFRLSYYLIRGYRRMHMSQRIDWRARLAQLDNLNTEIAQVRDEINSFSKPYFGALTLWPFGSSVRRDRYRLLMAERRRLEDLMGRQSDIIDHTQVYHAVIMATSNESIDILEPSVKALTEVDYPTDRLMLVIAYEERGGATTEANAKMLVERYGAKFALAMAIKHPDGIVGELRGKGANITYAGRKMLAEIRRRGIDPRYVVVTTFDSDHRASPNYFSYLTYEYVTDPLRKYKSYQPIPMFYNNIWDVPAAMRVIATGNTFWILMEMMRPHRLRNFAAHAQPLEALIDTDFWSVTTIVEDGHQYWRTYFRYDGVHDVVPLFTPVYQDAVLADTYPKTFKVQFLQLRRWAWGVSDVAYAVRHSIANTRIPWGRKLVQLGRLVEGHFSWATAPLILMFVAWMPLYLNRQFSYQALAHNLPIITSRILTVGSITMALTVLISLISLPPRPKRYRKVRHIMMILQWFMLPATSLCFSAFAAINAQTRLMLGRYLEFYVTDKATKKK